LVGSILKTPASLAWRRTTPILYSLRQALDEHRWLGFSIWTFALCSLSQRYGQAFLRWVLLRHPRRVLQGLLAYRRFLAQESRWGELVPIGVANAEVLWMTAAEAGPRFLVGLGFCQKPGDLGGRGPACPSGRFNHDCHYLEQLDADRPTAGLQNLACQQCTIRILGAAALHAGASLYIMTTALEIAEDFLLPALTENHFVAALLTLCPYSAKPIALPLLICGLKAGIATYDQGACLDYDHWLRADRGDKPERTSLPSEVLGKVLEGLEGVAEGRRGGRHFRRQPILWPGTGGNVYVPSL